MSEREKKLRDNADLARSTGQMIRLGFKEAIFSTMLQFVTGTRCGGFTLIDPESVIFML